MMRSVQKRLKRFLMIYRLQRCEALKIPQFDFRYHSPEVYFGLLLFFCLNLVTLGLTRFSPGSSADKEGGIKLIAGRINEGHKKKSFVKVVLENAAGATNSVGDRIEDLKDILNLVEVNYNTPRPHSHSCFRGLAVDKSKVGVCIDTCHAFCSGIQSLHGGSV
jgi:endonuclease IV